MRKEKVFCIRRVARCGRRDARASFTPSRKSHFPSIEKDLADERNFFSKLAGTQKYSARIENGFAEADFIFRTARQFFGGLLHPAYRIGRVSQVTRYGRNHEAGIE